MRTKQMGRRVLQFFLGLIVMALGIVLTKRVNLGISPITSIPSSLSNITNLTIGNLTTLLHIVCVFGQIIVERRASLINLLTILVGVVFGYIIDAMMFLIRLEGLSIPMRFVCLFCGLASSGLGLLLTVNSDLPPPSPDGLIKTISVTYGKKLSSIKIYSDAVYVVISLILDLAFTRRISSVGVGTVLSMLFVGRFVGLFDRLMPFLRLEPLRAPKEK